MFSYMFPGQEGQLIDKLLSRLIVTNGRCWLNKMAMYNNNNGRVCIIIWSGNLDPGFIWRK